MPRGPSVAVLSPRREPKHHLNILEPPGVSGGHFGRSLSWRPLWRLSSLAALSRRIQVQVFPEGAQDPLQRREEAGNEAKVPTLRGEDGYVSSEGPCPVAGLDRANTLFSLPLPRPWGAVCHQLSGKPSGHCPTVWKRGLWRVSLSVSLLGLKLAGRGFPVGKWFWCSLLGYLHQIHSGHTPSVASLLPKREVTDPLQSGVWPQRWTVWGSPGFHCENAPVSSSRSRAPCGSVSVNSVGESALLGLMCHATAAAAWWGCRQSL